MKIFPIIMMILLVCMIESAPFKKGGRMGRSGGSSRVAKDFDVVRMKDRDPFKNRDKVNDKDRVKHKNNFYAQQKMEEFGSRFGKSMGSALKNSWKGNVK